MMPACSESKRKPGASCVSGGQSGTLNDSRFKRDRTAGGIFGISSKSKSRRVVRITESTQAGSADVAKKRTHNYLSGGINPWATHIQGESLRFPSATFLLGGGMAVSASDEQGKDNSSVTDTTLSDVKELLNASSYLDYWEKELFSGADAAKESIVINATEYVADDTTAVVYRVVIDEATGAAKIVDDAYVPAEGETICLYSPAEGEIGYRFNVPETARYNIKIEYYPLTQLLNADGSTKSTDKAGSIERILKINGAIPFSEARYLVMTKVWKNIYTIKMSVLSGEGGGNKDAVKTYEDVAPYIEKAEACGIKYTVSADRSSIMLELPDGGWTSEITNKISESELRFFTTDIDHNEIRCTMERVPEWLTYTCKDVDGFYTERLNSF